MGTAVISPVAILKDLKAAGTATASQLGTTRAYLDQLADEGFVAVAGVVKTGKRGRPATAFKLAKRGTEKVRRSK